jgi:hypothetical protein
MLLGPIISRLFTCSNAEKIKKAKGALSSPISMVTFQKSYIILLKVLLTIIFGISIYFWALPSYSGTNVKTFFFFIAEAATNYVKAFVLGKLLLVLYSNVAYPSVVRYSVSLPYS